MTNKLYQLDQTLKSCGEQLTLAIAEFNQAVPDMKTSDAQLIAQRLTLIAKEVDAITAKVDQYLAEEIRR